MRLSLTGLSNRLTIRFICPRKVTHALSREVATVKKGLIETRSIVVDPDVTPGKTLAFGLDTNGNTGETILQEYGLV